MKATLIIICLIFISCAHHKDVRPNATGTHSIKLRIGQKGEGNRKAIEQANHFCEKRYKKFAAIVSESTKYVGSMDERSYQSTKTAARVAKTIGGTVWAMGGKKESELGGVVGLGGQVADSAAGLGYTYDMRFKCQ